MRGGGQRKNGIAEIMAKTEQVGDCLLWRGYIRPDGYGRIRYEGRAWLAHRIVWTLAKGEIPGDLTIDHLCRVRACVNVAHMEVVTLIENANRGGGLEIAHERWRNRTHCKNGHEYSPENTEIDRHGYRGCLTCKKRWWDEYAAALAAIPRKRARPYWMNLPQRNEPISPIEKFLCPLCEHPLLIHTDGCQRIGCGCTYDESE